MDEKCVIDKLDGSNWLTWKFQFRHLLIAKDLWNHVEGTAVLENGATEKKQLEFKKREQKAFSNLVLCISSSQLYLITSYETANEAWGNLRGHFERETLANKLFLKKRYFRMEMREGTSIKSHLKQMKDITDRLAAIGAPISEEDQVVTLLGSLPESYSTLVTALEASQEDPDLRFVQEALIHEEQKRQELDNIGGNQDTALVTNRENSKSVFTENSDRIKPELKCYRCHRPGHF